MASGDAPNVGRLAPDKGKIPNGPSGCDNRGAVPASVDERAAKGDWSGIEACAS